MKKSSSRFPLRCLVTCASLVASSAFAGGPPPANLDDVVYQDAGWGSKQMRSRGYTMVSSNYHKGKNVQYWWGASANVCVKAKEVDNKYESLKTTSSTDCNQYHEEARKDDSSAGIAVAAAAILGVAILASQSHQRDDDINQDANATAEFDRGYRDGLHHKTYHNYDNTTAYSDGYTQGQIERDEQTQHHSHSGHHSGTQAHVRVHDLEGAKASSADSEMRARGFTDTGGYKQGNKSYVTWWNARTRQCISAVTQGGRIKDLEAIDEGNCT